MAPSTALVWFRRDLRVHDHPALSAAALAVTTVLPLYVLDPALLHGRFASPLRTWFLLGCLDALRTALRERGSDLVIRIGEPERVLAELVAASGTSDVYVSRDHAPYGRARDERVADALRATGVAWHPRRGVLVHEPDEVRTAAQEPFSVYSPFRRAWEALEPRAALPAPGRLPPLPEGIEPGPLPTLEDLGLAFDPEVDPTRLPRPGEPAARERLASWLAGPVERYATSRDRLDDETGTSRLSADLHLGTISPLEVLIGAAGPGEGRRVFRNELVWREFYAHVLFHRPDVLDGPFRAEFSAIERPRDEAALEAWRTGTSGYPIVDAGMRQLAASGWMHNRARMVTASFLTKHLLQDPAAGEAWFMRRLIDGDVASNNGGWQWSASTGTDPQPYFRVFNPVIQGQRHDPDGLYVRRWLPELRDVPTTRIHAPWEMDRAEQAAAGCRIGLDYPAPIVDHREARARALAAYEAARSAAEPAGGRRRTS